MNSCLTLFAQFPNWFLAFESLKSISGTTHKERNLLQSCNACSVSAKPFHSGDVLAFLFLVSVTDLCLEYSSLITPAGKGILC